MEADNKIIYEEAMQLYEKFKQEFHPIEDMKTATPIEIGRAVYVYNFIYGLIVGLHANERTKTDDNVKFVAFPTLMELFYHMYSLAYERVTTED